MPRINRVPANLGGDEVMAAARDPGTLGDIVAEAGGAGAGQAQLASWKAHAPEGPRAQPRRRVEAAGNFFYLNRS